MPAAASVAAFVLLVAGGVALALLALVLAAAALHRSFSPLAYLGLPSGHDGRAWWLLAAMVVLAVLVWLVLRAGDEMLWFSEGHGGVMVPAAVLQGFAERVACRHLEVVRAQARLRVSGGCVLSGTLWLYCRPLAGAEGVRAEVEAEVRGALATATGAQLGTLVVRPRVLAVRQLKRHLP